MAGTRQDEYVFDTADVAERQRLVDQTALWDQFTLRRLAEVGVGRGWRCLEIGAGTGSIAAWLLERVVPDGCVVATDVETRWLEPLAGSNLEVRHHNVVTDPLDDTGYDLVHARLVLEHLPQRDAVVAKLVAALRPGGWLVIDDYDLCTIGVVDPPHAAWSATADAAVAVLRAAGVDPNYGSKLLGVLHAAGLVDVDAEGLVRPRLLPDLAPAIRPVLERMREPMIATGRVSADEHAEAVAEFDNTGAPRAAFTPLMVSARGRKP